MPTPFELLHEVFQPGPLLDELEESVRGAKAEYNLDGAEEWENEDETSFDTDPDYDSGYFRENEDDDE